MKPLLINENDKYFIATEYVDLADGKRSIIEQHDVTEEIEKLIASIGDDLKVLQWQNPVEVALFRKKWGFE